MADIYGSAALIDMVRLGLPDEFFFTQFLFSQQRFSLVEDILIDEMVEKKGIAPFVMPHVDGKAIVGTGYSTRTYRPAYIKLRDAIRASNLTKRGFGEPINGVPNALARLNAGRLSALEQHVNAIRRRVEWMCAQFCIAGGYTVSGERYTTQVLNFGRDASLTVVLSGAALWSAASTATPTANFRAWGTLLFTKGYAPADTVIMSPEAWDAFAETADIKAKYSLFKDLGGSLPAILPQVAAKIQYKGSYGGYNIIVFNDTYEDETGAVQRYLPAGMVLMVAGGEAGLGGRRIYGPIQHLQAIKSGMQQVEVFPYEWESDDGEAHMIGTQSAPLVAARKVNCVLAAQVI
mgnify:CR=1 FL=1